MKVSNFSLSLSKDQLRSLQSFIEPVLEYYATPPTIEEQVVGLVLTKLYRDKLLKKFAFPEKTNRFSLNPMESAALLSALLKHQLKLDEYSAFQVQQLTNQLHLHHA